VTEVLSRDDVDVNPGRRHRIVIELPIAVSTRESSGWSLITRPVAPNAIAVHVVEVRRDDPSDGTRPSTFSLWIDGHCAHADITAGEYSSIIIDSTAGDVTP
jgi:hypothetical protein